MYVLLAGRFNTAQPTAMLVMDSLIQWMSIASMSVNIIDDTGNALGSTKMIHQHSSIATPLLRDSRLAAQKRGQHWQRLGCVLTKLSYSVSYSMSICFNASIALSINFFTTFDE